MSTFTKFKTVPSFLRDLLFELGITMLILFPNISGFFQISLRLVLSSRTWSVSVDILHVSSNVAASWGADLQTQATQAGEQHVQVFYMFTDVTSTCPISYWDRSAEVSDSNRSVHLLSVDHSVPLVF